MVHWGSGTVRGRGGEGSRFEDGVGTRGACPGSWLASACAMGPRPSALDPGTWARSPGRSALGPGPWTLGSRPWALAGGNCDGGRVLPQSMPAVLIRVRGLLLRGSVQVWRCLIRCRQWAGLGGGPCSGKELRARVRNILTRASSSVPV